MFVGDTARSLAAPPQTPRRSSRAWECSSAPPMPRTRSTTSAGGCGLRVDRAGLRGRRREEQPPRLAQPVRAASAGAERGAGARLADDRRAANAVHVLLDRRRAAAAIVCSRERAAALTDAIPVTIAAAKLRSGHLFTSNDDGDSSLREMIGELYEEAAIGPEDLDVLEVHDAMAPVELLVYEQIGLCEPGEGPRLIRDGTTRIGGAHVVNPSGGLVSRGHPVGATGLAQVAELVWQLRGQAGARQANERPLTALAHNQGGTAGRDGLSRLRPHAAQALRARATAPASPTARAPPRPLHRAAGRSRRART